MKQVLYLTFLLSLLCASARTQVLVANLNQSNAGSRPEALQSDGQSVIFTALGDGGERRLYVVTGADGRAELLVDAVSQEAILHPFSTTLIDGVVYYYQHGEGTTTYYRVNLGDRVVTTLTTLPSPGANAGESYFTAVGDRVIFVHLTDDYIRELYATDGTAEGTTYLGDLPQDQYISELNTFGDRLFVTYDYGFGEAAPFTVTDGTAGGTFTRFPPPEFEGLYGPVAVGDSVIVSAYGRDSSGAFLTDAQFSELRALREWAPGLPTGLLGRFRERQGKLVFTRLEGPTGIKLWQVDPSDRSVELLADLNPERDSSGLQAIQVMGDLIFYRLYDRTTKTVTLRRTDGTQAGTFPLLDDIQPGRVNGFRPGTIVATEAAYFFLANRPETGVELWRTDGTARGTALVKDFYPGPDGPDIHHLAGLGAQLFFAAESPEFGREVFRSDGTAGGTQLVRDVRTEESGSYPNRFFTFRDTLFFTANTGCTGFETFKTGGSAATTELLGDLSTGKTSSFPYTYTPIGDEFFFVIYGEGFGSDRIFRTDGTVRGTGLLDPADETLNSGPSLSDIGAIRNRLLIRGYFPGVGQALYTQEVSTDQLQLLKVFSQGGLNGSGFGFTALNDSVSLFVESTDKFGPELWRTNGTAAGTYLVKDIRQVEEISRPYHIGYLTVIDGIAYFSADDGFGQALWRSDGTEEGTYQLANAQAVYGPRGFFKHKDRIYFVARQGMFGNDRIFSTQGQRFDVEASPVTDGFQRFRYIQDVVLLGNKFIFSASTDATGFELWTATDANTAAVSLGDLNAGPADSYPRSLTVFDSLVYFSTELPELGRELWSTDGTPEGTVLVADINSGTASGDPDNLYVYRDFLYFAADDGRVGSELWKYSPADLDNDGYTGADDADETDPLVNAGNNGDPSSAGVACPAATDTSSTAVHELGLARVRTFPNPTSDWLTVTTTGKTNPLSLVLLTSEGRPVYAHRGNLSSHTVPVAHLPAGNYALRVTDSTTGASLTQWVTVLY